MTLFALGAINKLTGKYVYPKIANKKDLYICPECNKDLILRQGEIRIHHFSHKVENIKCYHYTNPSETQIHKDAKLLMKTLLERKIKISFIRKCNLCQKNEEYEIPEINETSVIKLEYRFEFNGTKIADIAWINDDKLYCIFEICNTHKTLSKNRPEPWFEIDAETLINIANDNHLTLLQIPCIRQKNICNNCIENNNKRQAIQRISSYILRNIYKQTYIIQRENNNKKQAIQIISSYIRRNNYKQWYIRQLEKSELKKKEYEIYSNELKKKKYEKKRLEKKNQEVYTKEYKIYEEKLENCLNKQYEINEKISIFQLNIDDELNKVSTQKIINYYENIAKNNVKKCNNCKSNNNRCISCRIKISRIGKDMRIINLVSGLEQPVQ